MFNPLYSPTNSVFPGLYLGRQLDYRDHIQPNQRR